jgi:hypothetical protein
MTKLLVTKICTTAGCSRVATSRSMCAYHYRKLWRIGRFAKRRLPVVCWMPECCALAKRMGLCMPHYGRLRQQHYLNTNDAARKDRARRAAEYNRRHPEQAAFYADRWRRVHRWENTIYRHCLAEGRRRGITCDLDEDYIVHLWEHQKGMCYWLGIPMIPSIETRHPLRPSLDRLEPLRGYTRGNVVLTTMLANMGRSDYPADKFRALIDEMIASMRTR